MTRLKGKVVLNLGTFSTASRTKLRRTIHDSLGNVDFEIAFGKMPIPEREALMKSLFHGYAGSPLTIQAWARAGLFESVSVKRNQIEYRSPTQTLVYSNTMTGTVLRVTNTRDGLMAEHRALRDRTGTWAIETH